MSLVWHIVRKDLRRLAVPLALWLVLLVGEAGWLPKISAAARLDLMTFEGLGSFVMVWEVITLVVGFLLAAWLVMEDGLTSTQAFWRTRPIHGARLLAAKTAGALLMFSVLPVLMLVPVWLGLGFSAWAMAVAAGELAIGSLPFTLAAFTLACLTETSGQFLVRLVGATLVLPWLVMFALDAWPKGRPSPAEVLADSQGPLVFGALVLTAASVLVHQYLRRDLRRSVVVLAAGLVLMVAVGRFGPRNLSTGNHDIPPAATRVGEPSVRFTHTGDTAVRDGMDKEDMARIVVGGEVMGVPAGSYVRFLGLQGSWHVGGESQRTGRFRPTEGADLPPVMVVRQVAGLPPTPEVGTAFRWDALGYGPADWLSQWDGAPIRLLGTIESMLMRGEFLGRLPLREGAELQAGASRTRLGAVLRSDDKVVLRLEERDASPGRAAILTGNEQARFRGAWTVEDCYVLSGPAFPEPVLLGRGSLATVRLHSILLGRRELVITAPTREVDGRLEEIPGWEETTMLEKIRFHAAGTLERPFIADLQMPRNL